MKEYIASDELFEGTQEACRSMGATPTPTQTESIANLIAWYNVAGIPAGSRHLLRFLTLAPPRLDWRFRFKIRLINMKYRILNRWAGLRGT